MNQTGPVDFEDADESVKEEEIILNEEEDKDLEERGLINRRKRSAQDSVGQERLASSKTSSKKRLLLLVKNRSASQTHISPPAASSSSSLANPKPPTSRSLTNTPMKESDESTPRHSPRLLRSSRAGRGGAGRGGGGDVAVSGEESSANSSPEKQPMLSAINAEFEDYDRASEAGGSKLSTALFTVRTLDNNRKIFSCDKCGLEFTSPNSVVRHQEKSCLRVKVIIKFLSIYSKIKFLFNLKL